MSASVFPARAGMSREPAYSLFSIAGVPRASGDEPGGTYEIEFVIKCSPRERG